MRSINVSILGAKVRPWPLNDDGTRLTVSPEEAASYQANSGSSQRSSMLEIHVGAGSSADTVAPFICERFSGNQK